MCTVYTVLLIHCMYYIYCMYNVCVVTAMCPTCVSVCVNYEHLIHRWFVGSMQRYEVERLLSRPCCIPGTFLVREKGGSYSLAIKDVDRVRQFRIRTSDKEEYFLSSKQSFFKTIQELVYAYQEDSGELPLQIHVLHPYSSPWKPQITDLSRQTKSNWVIPREQLRITSRLNTEKLYEVWEGTWNGTTPVAIWTLSTSLYKELSVDRFLKKTTEMRQLSHRSLVQIYAVCVPEVYFIITEPVVGGELLMYLRNNRASLEVDQLLYMAVQIAEAMEYLEMKEFVHYSLSASNVLIDGNHICKVTDYGMFNIIDCDRNFDRFMWTAPEAIEANQHSSKSDVWSYGILLYELITLGRSPYPGIAKHMLFESLKAGYRMDCPHNCPEKLHNVMIKCWKAEPSERPCFGKLVNEIESIHSYLEDPNSDIHD